MRLSEIEKVTVPPSSPLSIRAMVNRSICRSSRNPASSHTFSTASSIAVGPHCPRGPILPVKHKAAELSEIEVAVVSVFRYRDGRQV